MRLRGSCCLNVRYMAVAYHGIFWKQNNNISQPLHFEVSNDFSQSNEMNSLCSSSVCFFDYFIVFILVSRFLRSQINRIVDVQTVSVMLRSFSLYSVQCRKYVEGPKQHHLREKQVCLASNCGQL